MDLEARARWVDYAEAKDEMFAFTDIKEAPWYVVDADDKRAARLNIISHLLEIVPYDAVPHAQVELPPRQHRSYERPPIDSQTWVPTATWSDERPLPRARRDLAVACANSSSWACRERQGHPGQAPGQGPRPRAHQRRRHFPLERAAPHETRGPGQAHHRQRRPGGRRPGRIGGRDRLADHDWNFGFIIDGFPRNARQAEFFLESYDIDGVINLHLPDEEVMRRVLARRLCSQCGLDYNLIAHRPRQPRRLRRLRWRLVARDDDNPEALATGWPPTTRRPGRSSRSSSARSSWSPSTPPSRWNESRPPSGSGSGCRHRKR